MHNPDRRWNQETTTDRRFASAIWQEARRRRVPVRGMMDGTTCRVNLFCTHWTAFKIVNQARHNLQQQQAAAKVTEELEERERLQREAAALRDLIATEFSHSVRHELANRLLMVESKLPAGDAGYSDDSWALDTALAGCGCDARYCRCGVAVVA